MKLIAYIIFFPFIMALHSLKVMWKIFVWFVWLVVIIIA